MRPGRALVGGLALALLVVAGGAVTGLIFGRDEADWKQPGLVISKERGQPYLVSTPEDGGLVIGRSSTSPRRRLILVGVGADVRLRGRHHRRADRRADRHPHPANVPKPQALVQSGWTACTSAESGLQLTLAPRPGVSVAPGAGFLVESRGSGMSSLRRRPGAASSPARTPTSCPPTPAPRTTCCATWG